MIGFTPPPMPVLVEVVALVVTVEAVEEPLGALP